ncbi:MAG: hypothetical protein AAGL69_15105 [Pseudomonadota bacterium]
MANLVPVGLIILIVAYLVFFRGDDSRYAEEELERDLLVRCRGDADKAERLIQAQLKSYPGISRMRAIRLAIRLHRRDQ